MARPTCCCCISLRTGALIVAALCVIGDGLSLLFSVFSHWESPVGDPIPFLGHLLKVLYMCLAVCLSVVGFIGARKRNAKLLQIFTIFLIFDFLLNLAVLIIGVAMAEDIFKDIICPNEDVTTLDGNDQCIPNATFIWIAVISLLVGFSLHLYCIYVIYRYTSMVTWCESEESQALLLPSDEQEHTTKGLSKKIDRFFIKKAESSETA
ncbi:hypothetical protein O0I10_008271 [Lichtheimia ornata]|uniref:Uncharacterized protein n=1 Tax=Lichtheimia ornata TaxID=688661 RepID=A0AAD7UYP6_9FUNG|nr:uncharacterized protein O0I10_008271 [Lichtheimia ornata]KAJ8656049.1 hypothetical protein O0I10_008271 [Lichtheimia ornata]